MPSCRCHQSRDYLIPHRSFPIDGPLEKKPISLTVSEIFNGECDAVVDMT